MKKNIYLIIGIIFITLIICMTNVNAEEASCEISLNVENKEIKEADLLDVVLNMSNVKDSKGIAGLLGTLDYDKEVLEIQYVEDEDISGNNIDEQFKDAKILYSGKQFINSKDKSAWYMISIQNSVFAATMGDPQKKSGNIGKITFKVKDGAKVGKTMINLTDVEVFLPEDISDDNELKGRKIESASISVNIGRNNIKEVENKKESTNNNIVIGQNSSNNEKAEQKNNKANKNIPYTGAKDIFPIICVVVLGGIISYKQYIKYRSI